MKFKIKTLSKTPFPIILLLVLEGLAIAMVRWLKNLPILVGVKPYEELLLITDFLNVAHFATGVQVFVFGLVVGILGIISVFLLWRVLREYGFSHEVSFIISLFYVVSPATISIFSQSLEKSFAVVVLLLAAFLAQKKSVKSLAGAVLLSLVLFVLDGVLASRAVMLGFMYSYVEKKRLHKHVFLVLLIAFFMLLLPQAKSLLRVHELRLFVSDFGGIEGMSVFIVLLAVIGMIFSWGEKTKKWYFTIILLFIVMLLHERVILLVNVLGVMVAGYAFDRLRSMEWKLKLIKNASLLVLSCGILFSFLSHATVLAGALPDNDFESAFVQLRSGQPGVVFSHSSNSQWIRFWSRMPVVDEKDISADILSFSVEEKVFPVFEQEKVQYVVLTKNLVGTVWDNENQGLLFFVRNSKTFKKIYENNGVVIWRREV